MKRRYAMGAEVMREGGTHFRVWAPRRSCVQVVIEAPGELLHAVALEPEENGYFAGFVRRAAAGSLYRFRLDDDSYLYPDPATRFQPQGPHGPSQVVDPHRYCWSDRDWKGVPREQVIYEMHIGTFTRQGTWEAAERELGELAAVGVTTLEIMPVAEFPGKFGWGYDGVNLFAPTRHYGAPDDFRRFVDRAHGHGLAVILDVVYNHLGPDGNYLKQFSESYFTDRYKNEWGEAINFDGPDVGPVREFFIANARYWIEEFHLDGLRLDATQQIFDASPTHILCEIGQAARRAAERRQIYVVAENEPQETRLVRPLDKQGYGLDALWNDDFHHAAAVALTGRNEAYYSDYRGTPQEFVSALKWGYLYQGQRYSWQKKRRGTPALDLQPANFVTFLENHDQVANSGRGQRLRLLTSPGRFRAMTAVLLLGPATPMLFQGQEYGSTRPFYYFADHHVELAKLVRQGRVEFLKQFPRLAASDMMTHSHDPSARSTFERCKLDLLERQAHPEIVALHKDLLRLRRQLPARSRFDGAVLGAEAFVLRFFAADGDDWLLVVNLGRDLKLREAPEPLLAPPLERTWAVKWSSEDWRYGGCGFAPLENEVDNWLIPGEAAFVLAPCAVEKMADNAT